MKTTILWRHSSLPIVLERYELDVASLPFKQSQAELENYIKTKADVNSKTWGYFPELKPLKKEYLATIKLAECFNENVIRQSSLLSPLKLNLAFVRRATAEPKSKFGGLHVDVSPGIDHVSPKNRDNKNEIFRLLFNLGDHPRFVDFAESDLEELARMGKTIKKHQYEILSLPDVNMCKVSIPPVEDSALYGIRFISSKIPHAGRTTEKGHFLISYGGYISQTMINRLFAR